MEWTKLFLAIIAVILTIIFTKGELQETSARISMAIRNQDYIRDSNSLSTVIGWIAGILWVIIYYL